MRQIHKGPEPREWTEYCSTPGVDYQAIPELRESLIKEQGYICAYCMRRITLDPDTTRIEHIKCRERYQDLKLKYSNMILCCNGEITNNIRHCDKSKSNMDISFDIFSSVFIDTLKYRTSDGTILSSNEQWNEEIEKVLNLNTPLLKRNRKEALDAVISQLGKQTWTRQDLSRKRAEWYNKDSNGHFKAYCGAVIWLIDRKLRTLR